MLSGVVDGVTLPFLPSSVVVGTAGVVVSETGATTVEDDLRGQE